MFTKPTFAFLDELAAHNRRDWFEANKARYEALVREPALKFIAAMAPELARFAPHFRADPRKLGGSLMRVYRDTRFARDKTPYKTNPPRGYAADHPAIGDLKRKDFIGLAPLSRQETLGTGLVKRTAKQFAAAAPFMAFLCEAVGVQY
ncbi:MAG: TIGR02453 family protein [Pseudomonadota bacterium]